MFGSQFSDRNFIDVPLPPWFTTPTFSPDYVIPLPAITSLEGEATSLDAIETADGAVLDYVTVLLSYSGAGQTWQLTPSTDETDVGIGRLRPLDYDADTNARVWFQL